jgi:hypothetical protein
MALELSTSVIVVAVLSWTLSAFLLVKLWRRADWIPIKLGLSLLLLIPVAGPLLYGWIQSFPKSNHPDLMDVHGSGNDILNHWRSRLELMGKLPLMKQYLRRDGVNDLSDAPSNTSLERTRER